MKRNKFYLIGLSFLLAGGLLVSTIRDIANHTILDAHWYHQIQTEIYYVDRLAHQLNGQLSEILSDYQVPKKYHREFFSSYELQKNIAYRSEQILKMSGYEMRDEINKLNEQTIAIIQEEVDSFFTYLNKSYELDEQLKAELAYHMVDYISSEVIQFKEMDSYEDSKSLLNVTLYKMTKPIGTVFIIGCFLLSILGMLCLSKFKFTKIVPYISLGSVISGLSLYLIYYIAKPLISLKSKNSLTLEEQLIVAGQEHIFSYILFAGQTLLVISLVIVVMVYGIRQYRHLTLDE